MTRHTIKLARARRLSKIGSYPTTFEAISRHVPAVVIERCSAAAIAATIDALYTCSQDAKNLALRDAVVEGCVWDAVQARHREIMA